MARRDHKDKAMAHLEKCGYATGGHVGKHADAAQDKRMISGMIHKAERERGEKETHFARGGMPGASPKGKHAGTHVNVIVAPQTGHPGAGGPPGGMPVAPRPPHATPPGAMGAPPPGGLPGQPMMHRGGRTRGR